MTHENQKIARIANALLEYFLSNDAKGLTLSISEDTKSAYISLEISDITLSSHESEELIEHLYMERQEEMEEYYWHLLGNESETEEISLIGMMVDEATVQYNYPVMKIDLVRHF